MTCHSPKLTLRTTSHTQHSHTHTCFCAVRFFCSSVMLSSSFLILRMASSSASFRRSRRSVSCMRLICDLSSSISCRAFFSALIICIQRSVYTGGEWLVIQCRVIHTLCRISVIQVTVIGYINMLKKHVLLLKKNPQEFSNKDQQCLQHNIVKVWNDQTFVVRKWHSK